MMMMMIMMMMMMMMMTTMAMAMAMAMTMMVVVAVAAVCLKKCLAQHLVVAAEAQSAVVVPAYQDEGEERQVAAVGRGLEAGQAGASATVSGTVSSTAKPDNRLYLL